MMHVRCAYVEHMNFSQYVKLVFKNMFEIYDKHMTDSKRMLKI